jgi:hypothetical protein
MKCIMKTFLQFLKEQAEASKDPQNQIERKKLAWVSSVEQLIAQAKKWLEEADRETKVLRLVVDRDFSINEEELGIYHAPCLQIWLGNKVVELRPIARNVVGGIDEGGLHIQAQGQVDITDRKRRIVIYRIKKEHDQDRWTIVDPDQDIVSELDRPTFEAAVQSLLE